MNRPVIESVRDHIAWSYANLARSHAALEEGAVTYRPQHHMIRARLFKGLKDGTIQMGSLYDDESVKMAYAGSCCYCGTTGRLSLDHLIPRSRGGADQGDNLVWACRSCNSSKGDRDLLEWMVEQSRFPPILLLRRYTKLVARHCDEHGMLDLSLSQALSQGLPFRLDLLPHAFPAPNNLVLWGNPDTPRSR